MSCTRMGGPRGSFSAKHGRTIASTRVARARSPACCRHDHGSRLPELACARPEKPPSLHRGYRVSECSASASGGMIPEVAMSGRLAAVGSHKPALQRSWCRCGVIRDPHCSFQ